MTTATLPAPSDCQTEERLGREVVVDGDQQQLDRYCDYLEKLAIGRGLAGQERVDHRFSVAVAAAGTHALTGDSLYSIEDFRNWWRRAEDMGAKPSALDANVIGRLFRMEIVPNVKLRTAAEALLVGCNHRNDDGQLTLETIASAAGVGCGTYVSRLLGINPSGDGYLKWYLGYDQAAAIARVVNVPYQELGL